LGAYSGKGGALHARIARAAQAVRELHGSGDQAAAVTLFVADTEPRLTDLAAAVRAAEMMPTERRRPRTARWPPSWTGSSRNCSACSGSIELSFERIHGWDLLECDVILISLVDTVDAAGRPAVRLRR